MLSPKGPLRVRSGRKPLAVLPWELVKEVGRKKGGKREKRGEGRMVEVGKEESPPSCLGYFQISLHLHTLFLGFSCCPISAPSV